MLVNLFFKFIALILSHSTAGDGGTAARVKLLLICAYEKK